MDNKVKVFTKDQTVLTIPTNIAVRFGKLQKMLKDHEGSLVNTTFDMQMVSTKAMEALIKCIEIRDAYLKCHCNEEEMPKELQETHGLCVRVDMETLTEILDIFHDMELNCQLNISQHTQGACIDLEYDSYFGYEEK